jgi:hypothetical protein
MDLKQQHLTLSRETLRELTDGDLDRAAGGTPTEVQPATAQLVDESGDPDELGIYRFRSCIR